MENPYLTAPQVEGPQSRSWSAGFLYGFQGPALSATAQADVQSEDADAFNEGVLAGQDAAINGLPLAQGCVDLNVERPEFAHLAATESAGIGTTLLDAFKAIVEVGEAAAHAAAGAVLGGILDFVTLSIALETFNDDPDQAITDVGGQLQDALQRLGYDQGMQLFVGGGVDLSEGAVGCELKLTAIYRGQEGASAAAKAMGRPHYLVASWRTDLCGGISVVERG
nr:hypothetical protein [uncultured Duganella sp.]